MHDRPILGKDEFEQLQPEDDDGLAQVPRWADHYPYSRAVARGEFEHYQDYQLALVRRAAERASRHAASVDRRDRLGLDLTLAFLAALAFDELLNDGEIRRRMFS